MNASVKQLRVFEATARLGRLTAAADEQSMSQSAASQSLRELESTLNCPLFQRVGRELMITEAGRDMLPKVNQILHLLDSLQTPEDGPISGPLRIAASVTIASYLLPRLLAAFIRQHPEVVPDVKIENTQQVIATLEKGQAHIGLIEGPAQHRQLKITPWHEDKLEVFCHTSHPQAQAGQLLPLQLEQQRWILREDGSGTRRIFDSAMQALNIQAHVAFALNRQEAIKQSVKAGLGVGCLSQLAIIEEVKLGSLVVLNTPLELTRRFSLVIQPSHNNRLTKTFIEFVNSQTQ
ncbi:LysR family transcriptional regulator [Neptunomonas qingdaonensis]|uniref:DNA-binding transcriptional regulator, LysR family n=1 Tax=Neptunomonas qingdaonensis TaxID=1045558 RepID=A0A1I2PWA6_9GAMM|nr:LysR family transcriptional regulator [Neptunomonas qingdaonensis]SFG18287.1 DNA-binding transcriptional regulator, LysR family [Neptunomonas qingdaonensis]